MTGHRRPAPGEAPPARLAVERRRGRAHGRWRDGGGVVVDVAELGQRRPAERGEGPSTVTRGGPGAQACRPARPGEDRVGRSAPPGERGGHPLPTLHGPLAGRTARQRVPHHPARRARRRLVPGRSRPGGSPRSPPCSKPTCPKPSSTPPVPAASSSSPEAAPSNPTTSTTTASSSTPPQSSMKERLLSRGPDGFFVRSVAPRRGDGLLVRARRSGPRQGSWLGGRAVKAGRRPPGGEALMARSVGARDHGFAKPVTASLDAPWPGRLRRVAVGSPGELACSRA